MTSSKQLDDWLEENSEIIKDSKIYKEWNSLTFERFLYNLKQIITILFLFVLTFSVIYALFFINEAYNLSNYFIENILSSVDNDKFKSMLEANPNTFINITLPEINITTNLNSINIITNQT